MWNAKWNISRCIRHGRGRSGNRRRSDWIRVDNVPRIFVIVHSSRDPVRLGEREHPCRRLQGPDHLHVNVQYIEWETNDENRISNAEKIKNYAMRFLQGHKTFLGPGVGREMEMAIPTIKRTMELDSQQNDTAMSKETGHLVFKSTSASSREILKQMKGRRTIHFNGDSMNTELLFQTVHSVNQLSVYGAVTNWCYQFGLKEEEKGRVGIPVDKKVLTMVEPQEVQLLLSFPTQAFGNRMLWRCWASKHWKRRYSWHNYVAEPSSDVLWKLGIITQFDRMMTMDGEQLLFCAENIRVLDPKTKALAAIPEGTTIGPVLEVHIVEILDGYGIEVAIQSIWNPENTSHVVIVREAERFVSEIHDHKQELRSSDELLADLQGSGRSEVYEERKVTKSFRETWASPSTKETCAGPLILTPRKASLFTSRIILTGEKKWKTIHACSPDGGHFCSVSFKDGHNNASPFWPRGTTTWCFTTLGFN